MLKPYKKKVIISLVAKKTGIASLIDRFYKKNVLVYYNINTKVKEESIRLLDVISVRIGLSNKVSTYHSSTTQAKENVSFLFTFSEKKVIYFNQIR